MHKNTAGFGKMERNSLTNLKFVTGLVFHF